MEECIDDNSLTIGRAIDIFESALSLMGVESARDHARWGVVAVDDGLGFGIDEMSEHVFIRKVTARLSVQLELSQSDLFDHLPSRYAQDARYEQETEPESPDLDDILNGEDDGWTPDVPPIPPNERDPVPDDVFGPHWSVDKSDAQGMDQLESSEFISERFTQSA